MVIIREELSIRNEFEKLGTVLCHWGNHTLENMHSRNLFKLFACKIKAGILG